MQLLSGVAGARGCDPSGVVIHNDAASQGATTNYYRNWLPSHDAALGFAHYYVCSDGTLQAEYEENMAWHTANANGNANYIGIEACQSMGNLATFRDNEQGSIKLAAEILKRYGLQANRNTVILHKQFSSTACPHRSVTLHGDWTVMQDYFIAQINKYMGTSSPSPTPSLAPSPGSNAKYVRIKKSARAYGKSSQGRLIPTGARGMAFTVLQTVKVAYDKRIPYEYLIEYQGKREWVISTDVEAAAKFDPQVIVLKKTATHYSKSSQKRVIDAKAKGRKYTVLEVMPISEANSKWQYLIHPEGSKQNEWVLEQDITPA